MERKEIETSLNRRWADRAFGFTALWLVLVVCTLAFRPLMPIDETRCVSIAWEMYQSGDYFVPHLNGEPYSQKPPLLFWLMILGWKLFGVNEWWPRLLPPLFGLGSLFLIRHIARTFWPDNPDVSLTAPNILIGTALWTFFTTVVMYDMAMIFFLLLSFVFYLRAWEGNSISAWLLAGVSLGLGILAKGAVVLIPAGPVLLCLPWCTPAAERRTLISWYAGAAATGLAALFIGFSWLAGAELTQGAGFVKATIHDQYLGRVANSFDHPRPSWWYLSLVPAILFPWSANLAIWRGWRCLSLSDAGVRFCLAWTVPAFCVFSLISGKQIYYVLPLLPPLSLLFAHLVCASPVRRSDVALISLVIAIAGIGLLVVPHWAGLFRIPEPLRQAGPAGGIVLLIAACLLPFVMGEVKRSIFAVAGTMVIVLVVVLSGVFAELRPAYDMKPAALYLKNLQEKGYPLAHEGKYYGEYHFLGRLTRPMEVVVGHKRVHAWLTTHPGGRVVVYFRDVEEIRKEGYVMEYFQPYGGKYMAVVRVSTPYAPPPAPGRLLSY